MYPKQLLSQLSSCVTAVLARRAMGGSVPHGGCTPASARCRSNSFEAPSANFKANLSARQLSNQNSKVIFASESNKNCSKYTFWLFPDHSIFRERKSWIHLAFLASKDKLNVHQIAAPEILASASIFSLLQESLCFLASFDSQLLTQDTKPLKHRWFRTPSKPR